ncbi:hypothetical protein QJS66_02470 [Kocuria rhizophila]|nr:hypothetical protein QJS66_02470 [Kocuria rhizophila]
MTVVNARPRVHAGDQIITQVITILHGPRDLRDGHVVPVSRRCCRSSPPCSRPSRRSSRRSASSRAS